MSVLDGWRFCPRCAARLTFGEAKVECTACGFVTYANSAPTASAVVLGDDGRILLARRAQDPFRDHWDLPGGFLNEGEHPLAGLHRELSEETGLEIEPVDFLGTFMDVYGDGEGAASTLNLIWTARVVGGSERAADDAAELRWFHPRDLPAPGELAFTALDDVLAPWRQADA